MVGDEVDVICRLHVGKSLLQLGSSAVMAVQWAELLLQGKYSFAHPKFHILYSSQ
jgi:hypothetical protein